MNMDRVSTTCNSFSEMKMDELDVNHELKNYCIGSQNKNDISNDVIQQYKFKYPTTFAELKLDGFSNADAVRYIRNNIEYDNDNWHGYKGNDNNYIPGSSMTFMKTIG